MHTLWQLHPIWDLWSQVFVVTWDFCFPCWPQSDHSTPPEQHRSLQESWQKSFYYVTAAQHILHHCRSYLQQWVLILHYSPYGARFGVSTEESQALLCWAQFRAICEWLYSPGSQFMYSLCAKIQNQKSQNKRSVLQNAIQSIKGKCKHSSLWAEEPMNISAQTQRRFPGTGIRCSQHTGRFMNHTDNIWLHIFKYKTQFNWH